MIKPPEKTGCAFCDALANHKWANRLLQKQKGKRVRHEYATALIIHSWTVSKKNAGRLVDYRNKGLGFKLNYCPECGREIHGVKRSCRVL